MLLPSTNTLPAVKTYQEFFCADAAPGIPRGHRQGCILNKAAWNREDGGRRCPDKPSSCQKERLLLGLLEHSLEGINLNECVGVSMEDQRGESK